MEKYICVQVVVVIDTFPQVTKNLNSVSSFIFFRAPDTASIKDKMVHSASLAAVKSKLNVKDVIQASDLTELDEDTICEKVHVKIDKEHLKQQRECHRMHQMGQVQQMEGDH